MPLASALPSLQSSLQSSFSTATQTRTPVAAASEMSDAMFSFATAGIPMTMHSGNAPLFGLAPGQPVAGAVTTTPGVVTGTGEGGIDVPVAGMGLSAAKSILESTLTTIFTNNVSTSALAATLVSNAVNTFLSQAKIMTTINGIIPPGVPVPPPAGPVTPSSYTGSGTGGIDSSSPGAGLSATKSILQLSLVTVFTNFNNSPADAAKGIADALLSYFKSAMITTVDSGTAGGGPAIVAPPPAPPLGSTGPLGSNIIAGASTSGVIA